MTKLVIVESPAKCKNRKLYNLEMILCCEYV